MNIVNHGLEDLLIKASDSTKEQVVEVLHEFGYELEQLDTILTVATNVRTVLILDDFKLSLASDVSIEDIEKFRFACLTKDVDTINKFGTVTWVDDVLNTDLKWAADSKTLVNDLLWDIATCVRNFRERRKDGRFGVQTSFSNATYNRLESLGWKTYLQLVNTIYKTKKRK